MWREGKLPMTVPQCTGVCCSRFPIGGIRTHEEVFSMLANNGIHGKLPDGEAQKIRSMLIVIPPDEIHDYDTYTCKHWNKETMRCIDYENRPLMCVEYPYGRLCEHCGGGIPPSDAEPISTSSILLERDAR